MRNKFQCDWFICERSRERLTLIVRLVQFISFIHFHSSLFSGDIKLLDFVIWKTKNRLQKVSLIDRHLFNTRMICKRQRKNIIHSKIFMVVHCLLQKVAHTHPILDKKRTNDSQRGVCIVHCVSCVADDMNKISEDRFYESKNINGVWICVVHLCIDGRTYLLVSSIRFSFRTCMHLWSTVITCNEKKNDFQFD